MVAYLILICFIYSVRYVPYCLDNWTNPITIISSSPWSLVTLPSPWLRAGSMASQGGRPRARAIASIESWRAGCASCIQKDVPSGRRFDTHMYIYIYMQTYVLVLDLYLYHSISIVYIYNIYIQYRLYIYSCLLYIYI